MAYTTPNYYPQSYYPYVPQAPVAPTSPFIWVQGEAGAKSYMVAPGATVILWDSEAQAIYIKTADASGIPSIRTIEYTFRDPAPAPGEYATKTDLAEITKKLDELAKVVKGE